MAKQVGVLVICLLVHVFVLNLVVVNGGSFHFYINENTTMKAVLAHGVTALLSGFMFVLIIQVRKAIKHKAVMLSDRVWFLMALAMMAALGLLLLP